MFHPTETEEHTNAEMQGNTKICRVLGSGSFLSSAVAITSTPSRQLVAPRAFLVRASAWHLPWVEKLHHTAQSCVQSISMTSWLSAVTHIQYSGVRAACMPILLGARAVGSKTSSRVSAFRGVLY